MSRLTDLIKNHPIRKSETQKVAFRKDIIADMEARGSFHKQALIYEQ